MSDGWQPDLRSPDRYISEGFLPAPRPPTDPEIARARNAIAKAVKCLGHDGGTDAVGEKLDAAHKLLRAAQSDLNDPTLAGTKHGVRHLDADLSSVIVQFERALASLEDMDRPARRAIKNDLRVEVKKLQASATLLAG